MTNWWNNNLNLTSRVLPLRMSFVCVKKRIKIVNNSRYWHIFEWNMSVFSFYIWQRTHVFPGFTCWEGASHCVSRGKQEKHLPETLSLLTFSQTEEWFSWLEHLKKVRTYDSSALGALSVGIICLQRGRLGSVGAVSCPALPVTGQGSPMEFRFSNPFVHKPILSSSVWMHQGKNCFDLETGFKMILDLGIKEGCCLASLYNLHVYDAHTWQQLYLLNFSFKIQITYEAHLILCGTLHLPHQIIVVMCSFYIH